MKKVLPLFRWIVGLLFIFSGMIKVNDPLGLSYKMQEFFEVWGLEWLNPFTLSMSIIMNVLEVVSGAALLIGFKMKYVSRFLLLLIIFFTFLTGYALFSGKIKTCGCLGDCLPLTPAMSFTKDLVLLGMIVVITIYWRDVKPVFKYFTTSNRILLALMVVCILLQDLVVNYLPVIDCLPFKVGNNLIEQMKKPKDYVPDSTVITYQYKRKGQMIQFDQEHFPEDFDSTYEYVNRIDKLVRKGSGAAKITDFTLTTLSGNDSTQEVLKTPKYVMIMSNAYPSNFSEWQTNLKAALALCTKNHIPVFYVTSQTEEEIALLAHLPLQVLKCDMTAIKTAARVNSTYFFMDHATILQKCSDRNPSKITKSINALIAN